MEEVLKDTPNPVNGMLVKSEPEDPTKSPTNLAGVQVHTQGDMRNQKLITIYFSSEKAPKQDDPEIEDSPKKPDEESLDEPCSSQVSDDEHSSGDEKNSSDEESLVDSELEPAESSGHDSDFDPMECTSKPGNIEIPSKPTKRKRKERISASSSFNEKVKGLMQSNILGGANANSNKQQLIPVSQQKNKKMALEEEVAKHSIEDQLQAKKDANSLINDSKKFEPSPSIISMNWKVRGLKTLLKHHQV